MNMSDPSPVDFGHNESMTINFCCRKDRSTTYTIPLPAPHPFILIKVNMANFILSSLA